MIPTADRVGLLDRARFSNRQERMAAARLPIGKLRRLVEDREVARRELERLIERDG